MVCDVSGQSIAVSYGDMGQNFRPNTVKSTYLAILKRPELIKISIVFIFIRDAIKHSQLFLEAGVGAALQGLGPL